MPAPAKRFAADAARRLVFGIFVASAWLTGPDGAWAAQPRVDTVAVTVQPRQSRSEWNGIVSAVQESSLTAQVAGRIEQVLVRAGDRVTAGQELAVIDARESTAGTAQAQAQLAQARATQSGAQAAWERNQRLFDQGFISKASLDESVTQLAAARAAVAQAIAALKRQSVTTTYLSIRAPYDGVVTAVTAEVGEIAQPGRPLVRMHSPDALRVSIRVPSAQAAAMGGASHAVVQVGAQAARTPATTAWSDPLPMQVMPAADASSATVEIRIDLPQALSAGLRPGEYLRVATFSPDGEGLFMPASALLERGELKAAYVASDDRFVLRALRVGPRDGDRLEVLSGLVAGERVAIDPVRAGLKGAQPAQGR
ncbi:MAG: efflux RND transporter periplasmic adaptor subunit [Burkholderiaceae bacterium]